MKVYEIESSIILSFNFEVDAKDKADATAQANLAMKNYLATTKREYNEAEVTVDSVEISEGH
jgi:hypothetical protein